MYRYNFKNSIADLSSNLGPQIVDQSIEAAPIAKAAFGVDSRRLSNRIFLFALVATFLAQFVFAVYTSWSAYSDHMEFTSEGMDIDWPFFVEISEFAWLLFVPLIAALVCKLNYSGKWLIAGLGIIGFAGFLFSALVVHTVTHYQFDMFSDASSPLIADCLAEYSFWLDELITSLLHLVALGALAIAVRYWLQSEASTRQAERMRQSIHQLRHEVLTNRLQPHFLFNTLNTISALTADHPERAREVIGRLGDLLRNSIDSMNLHEIQLRREYSLVKDYLAIQKIRFGDRLNYQLELPEPLAEKRIPAFLLQPLIENSVKHGLNLRESASDQRVNIHVSAEMRDDQLQITVRDDGLGTNVAPESIEHHLGLRLTRERLQLQFGPKADVKTNSNGGQGFAVVLGIPASEVAANE